MTDKNKQRAEEIRRWLCTDCDRTFSAPYLKHTAPGYSVPTYCDPGPNGWEPFIPEFALSEAVAEERERCAKIVRDCVPDDGLCDYIAAKIEGA